MADAELGEVGLERSHGMNAENEILLPQPPEGLCVQTALMRPGTASANTTLATITREGGQIVAVRPLFSEPKQRWHLLVIYFLPVEKAGTVLRKGGQ
jgi:hypothetical protein